MITKFIKTLAFISSISYNIYQKYENNLLNNTIRINPNNNLSREERLNEINKYLLTQLQEDNISKSELVKIYENVQLFTTFVDKN